MDGMMYQSVIFDGFYCERDLDVFLNTNKIKPEDIITISLSCDANASQRLVSKSVNRILLTYISRR